MFSNASYVLLLAIAAFATTDTAAAQTTARRHASLQKTVGATEPKVPFAPHALSATRGFALRQDLFDRANPNNLRSSWPGPPAQPGQF